MFEKGAAKMQSRNTKLIINTLSFSIVAEFVLIVPKKINQIN